MVVRRERLTHLSLQRELRRLTILSFGVGLSHPLGRGGDCRRRCQQLGRGRQDLASERQCPAQSARRLRRPRLGGRHIEARSTLRVDYAAAAPAAARGAVARAAQPELSEKRAVPRLGVLAQQLNAVAGNVELLAICAVGDRVKVLTRGSVCRRRRLLLELRHRRNLLAPLLLLTDGNCRVRLLKCQARGGLLGIWPTAIGRPLPVIAALVVHLARPDVA
mmetsp:Transcript_15394/g.51193  ORF Transcript_15394/g.51193 Transcript_15394/m.51193 type:complete len:220 (-) Transcript_15394:593-1252(-)